MHVSLQTVQHNKLIGNYIKHISYKENRVRKLSPAAGILIKLSIPTISLQMQIKSHPKVSPVT